MIRPWERKDAQAFADSLTGKAPSNDQIGELVRFAEYLCVSAAAEPSTPFTRDLRATLMHDAETVLTKTHVRPRADTFVATRPTRNPVRRRLAALTTTLVISAGGVGLVASSASALPGEMLYPVKRTVESVELAMHNGDVDRATFELELASERLDEAQSIIAAEGPIDDDLVTSTLQDFAQRAQSGSTTLLAEESSEGDDAERVQDFAASANATLLEIESLIPSGASEAFVDASQMIGRLVERVATVCSDCSGSLTQSLRSAVQDIVGGAAAPPDTSAVPDVAPLAPTADQQAPNVTSPVEPKSPVVEQPKSEPTEPSPGLLDPVTGLLLGGGSSDSGEPNRGLIPGLLGILVGD